jgi:hypothetical protein
MRSHEEHVRGTHWEIIWNLMGTQRKFYGDKKNSRIPLSLERKKKLGPFGCMLLHFIGCKNSFCLDVFF